ncbi:unnamed protein product, partial [Brenthis ino]
MNSASWDDGDLDSTADPSILMLAEEVPTLTVATILGVTVVLLIAIVLVFVLGFLIDWRQQRLLDKRIGEAKRKKAFGRKSAKFDGDAISIANNMEEASSSIPPAEVFKNIP